MFLVREELAPRNRAAAYEVAVELARSGPSVYCPRTRSAYYRAEKLGFAS